MTDGPETGEILREPSRLGSLSEWAEEREMDPKDPETLRAYTGAMGEHTQQRASWLGISVEELHGLPSEDAVEELEAAARERDQRIAV